MLTLCDEEDLASVNPAPLLCGVLTGRLRPGTELPASDLRRDSFNDEPFAQILARAESLRPMLTTEGRSYVHGALAWIRARSPRTIPIPGFRTIQQVRELIETLHLGPLSSDVFARVTATANQPR